MTAPPLHVTLTPSRRLMWALSSAHVAAMVMVLVVPLPMWAQAGAMALLAVSLIHSLRRHASLSAADAIVALSLHGDDAMLFRRDGREVAGRLLGNSTVTPYLSILNVRPQGARWSRSVVIVPDGLDAEMFRQLRVWLRWGMPQP
jgi:toxin CptA